MAKNKNEEEEIEVRPKWVKPENFQKREQPEPRQEWVNPKHISYRERMDRRLERAGLLNYQTEGLSAEEIAQKYAANNIKISGKSSWFKDNYGFDAPETITNRGAMNQWREQAAAGNVPNIFPQVPITMPGQGQAGDESRFNFVTGPNGLLIKVPKTGQTQTQAASPYAAEVFATNEQAMKGEVNWTDVSSTERTRLLQDPNFYKSGQITQYPAWQQQQILADPSFDWEQLPKWQKTFFDLSSSPAVMGAVQGTIMGLGNPGGTVAGTVLGWLANKYGYDPLSEYWEQDNAMAGAFGLMNWLAEQAEKGVGVIAQSAAILTGNDPNFDPKKRNLDIEFNKDFNLTPGKDFNPELLSGSSWDAGAGFFEVIGPAYRSALKNDDGQFTGADIVNRIPLVSLYRLYEAISDPEKYKGKELYLGANEPIQLDQTWVERLNEAEKEIKGGRPYREVMMDLQAGVVAQISDMVGQAAADPLNVMPDVSTKVLGKVAELQGNKVAATALNQSKGLVEAGRRYRTFIQTEMKTTIDPNFKVDEMGTLSRLIGGINDKGEVRAGSLIPTQKGLLDPVTGKEFVVNQPLDIVKGIFKDPIGLKKHLTEQDPYSRARAGAGMFYENVSAMMQMFETPEQAAKYIKALANSDMNTWAELGTQFAESPEFYTVLPALKEFKGSLDGITQTWEMSGPNRDLLARVADIMGDQPGTLLEDLAKRGTAEQDFQRVIKRAGESQSPMAKALLADVEAGRFTAETLKQMIDVFTGEDALPWHPGQWKALMLDKLGDHFDQWVTQRLMLDQSPEAKSAFFRTSALMKQAQSILLLGGSPGYAITNGLSNMVHRAVSGVFGYMTGRQIDTFMDRFGLTPARFDEGVGIGGQVEQAAGISKVKTTAMEKAVRGKGALTTAKDALAKLSKGMPFSKISSMFERSEGRQAFSIAMRDAWSQSWRRGVGFREMSPELARVMTEMGVDPKRVYAAIEAGMNQTEIENALMGRRAEVQARSLIHDAAEKTGMSASEAAQMLERIGILDTLDQFLAGQTTRDGVAQAFKRAERTAQDWMDMRTGEDLKAKAEHVKQRVGLEGPLAALDVVQQANAEFIDAWMNHFHRMGEVMGDLTSLGDDLGKAWDLAYEESIYEYKRINATNATAFKGIWDAWGLSGDPSALRFLNSIGEIDKAMGGSYRTMLDERKAWREKWANDPKNPVRWDEFHEMQARHSSMWAEAFKTRHNEQVKMGAALSEIYEAQHGPAAGEAARQWWEDVVAFNDEIVKREQDFRGEMAQAARAGVPKELIEAQKQKYYSETKILLIAELEKINSEGIGRLERVIKGRGGSNQVPTPPPAPSPEGAGDVRVEPTDVSAETTPADVQATRPAESGADEINALMTAAEQRKGKEKAEADARKAAVWDVAEEYWGKGSNYSRGILQDGFALVGALRKAEYGGIPDLIWLDDPRLTPELTRQILETRKAAKETSATAAAEQAFTVTEKKRVKQWDATQINENTTILRAVALHGGLNLELKADIVGDKKAKTAPGMFQKRGLNKGLDIEDMARELAYSGYPIDVNRADDPGGVRQATELIQRAMTGDKVYPMGHDFSAEIDAAEAAWIEGFNFDEVAEVPFDSALWQTEFDAAVQAVDLGKVYELIGTFPDEMLDAPSPLPSPEGRGGSWRDYLSRVADDVAVRADENARAESVAGRAAEVQETLTAAEQHAEAVTKRTVLLESLAEAFKLDEKETAAYGELSDAVADWYARFTGETRDDFYNRYFGDVRRGDQTIMNVSEYPAKEYTFTGEWDRQTSHSQKGSKVARRNRETVWYPIYKSEDGKIKMSKVDPTSAKLAGEGSRVPGTVDKGVPSNYYPSNKAMNAYLEAEGLNNRAEKMSPSERDHYKTLFKEKIYQYEEPETSRIPGTIDKGMVTFEEMKATITAFEAADFTTVIHESGHVYRRVLKDVAERTGNPYILRDLTTIEEWAGVKDGNWTREAEEKFARGFERYITEGNAPTPKLRAAFESFKKWMLDVYKSITGSSIDVKLTDDVRRVFDRMLGAENMRIDLDNQLKQMNYDPRLWYVDPMGNIVKRPEFTLEVDKAKAARDVEAMDLEGMQARAAALRERMAAGAVQAGPDAESLRNYREGWRSWSSMEEPPVPQSKVRALKDWTLSEMQKAKGGMESLFQVDIKTFADYIKDKYGLKTFSLYEKNAGIELDMIEVYKENRGQGVGSNAMQELIKYADENGKRLLLSPAQKGDLEGTTSRRRLIEFYKQFGFVENKGRNKNFDFRDGMYREPKPKTDPSSLFQSEVPFGMFDEKAQFRPGSDGMDALWREKVMPLLRAMEAGASEQLSVTSGLDTATPTRPAGEGAARDMSPEGQAMLKRYMQQVKGEMATTKLATVRFAEKQRDFALLNYSKRYGVDRMADFLATYQLYPSRSLVNWMARAVDKPALFSNYARLRMQQERYERDIPERLRGKIRISAPWLPEWAGDSLYIDPLRNLFFPDTVARFFERAQRDKNYQVIEAERVLQEWQADGQYSDAEIIEAAKTQQGKVWERAWAEAQIRRESETSNPVDFFTSFFGPSWYLATPLNLAGIRVPGISKGDPNAVNTIPLGNTSRALDTVTQGTWAEPVGDLIGLIGKGEDRIREAFKLPTRGEYAEYYTKRQVANMVAEGKISAEDAQLAMIEKQGTIWEEAKQRVDMELAMRVPLAGVTYAALHDGPLAGAQAAIPSLFGASLLPEGELEYRGLKQEWNEAWKLADAGDTKAVQRFLDEHPEYEAWLAKNKDDGELLKSFLIGQIWDAYMELGDTNQKQARAELGDAFRESFLNKETRSYETLDVEQLAAWARLLGGRVPSGLDTPATNTQATRPAESMQLYPEQVTGITDQYFEQRRSLYPNYYEEQAGYYALPKSERKKYLMEHPDLKKYWDWKDKWYDAYPQFVPIFNGDAFDRVDTSGWMPGLEDAVAEAAMTNGRLPQGARAALMNEWLLAGQPMGDFDTWVKGVVMPGMLYGN